MALHNITGSNYLRLINNASITLSSANWLLAAIWIKPVTTAVTQALFAVAEQNNSANHRLSVSRNAGHNVTLAIRSNTAAVATVTSSNTLTLDAWNLVGVLSPPHNGTTDNFGIYLGGTLTAASRATENYTTTSDTLFVGHNLVGNIALADDRLAHFGLFAPADQAAATALMASLATTPPRSISGVAHAWDLIEDGNADAGGVNLETIGSPSYDSDDPYAAAPAAALGNRMPGWW